MSERSDSLAIDSSSSKRYRRGGGPHATLSPIGNRSGERTVDIVDASMVPYIDTPTFSRRDEGGVDTSRAGSSISDIDDRDEGGQEDHTEEHVEEPRPWRLGDPYYRCDQPGANGIQSSPLQATAHSPPGIMPMSGNQPLPTCHFPQHPRHVGQTVAVYPPTNVQLGGAFAFWVCNRRLQYMDSHVNGPCIKLHRHPCDSATRSGIREVRRKENGVDQVARQVAIGMLRPRNRGRRVTKWIDDMLVNSRRSVIRNPDIHRTYMRHRLRAMRNS